MTQRGKETSPGSPSMSDSVEGRKETPWLAPSPEFLCAVLKCSPRAAAAALRPKSTVSQSPGAARGGPASSSLGLTFLPGLLLLSAPAFSRRLSICMRRNQSLLGLDRTAELTAVSCPLLKDITLSRQCSARMHRRKPTSGAGSCIFMGLRGCPPSPAPRLPTSTLTGPLATFDLLLFSHHRLLPR